MAENLLQVEQLCLRREGRDILREVNLTVQTGQVHALLGPNGSGKSSLAAALMGCQGYAPDSGRILFAGQDITRLPIDERGRLGITLAWQEPARFEGLLVRDYLALSMAQPQRDRIEAALAAVALRPDRYLRRAVDKTLSGGERKRIELAAVYAMRPRLAILDEPDSGIDVLSLEDVGRLIRQMAHEGITVLLITHRHEMADAADVASLMCLGRILSTGRPAQVQTYFSSLCRPHEDLMGPQPWQASLEWAKEFA